MYVECRHILPSGYKCKAAALKGKAFCYHHHFSRRPVNIGRPEQNRIMLPSVEDAAGVSTALNQVLVQFGLRKIDRFDAGTFFHGLQIAASLVRKIPTDLHPRDTVREIFKGEDFDFIGPEKMGCDLQDCKKCSKRYNCKDNPTERESWDKRSR